MSTEEFNHQLTTLSFDQSSAPPTDESAVDKKSKQSGRAIRSWIFTKGYARRTRREDSTRHVECLVSGCGKKYTSHDGSTSNIGRHLLRAHGIAKDGISAIKVRTNFIEQKITRKSPAPTHQGAKASPESLNRKLIEFTLDFGLPLEILESTSFKEVLRAAQRSPPIDTLSLPNAFFFTSQCFG
ncbi:hypothetical protein DSO57_1015376 [Entomophthora muscae]|uniref:Uncharacterized protein n=1 Tax=Entomophthora muscae TaxID=34485 RepID=A0ACC2RWF3_9FUNG|nr:hypothetical protein DSO57_1015376 [Entomophthora muscae]